MTRPGADLQGDLAVFAPELLFQMMALARASGELVLHSQGREARVVFVDGQLRFATGERGRQARLGEMLVRVGKLEPAERARAVRAWRRAGGKQRLGAILVDRGLIAPEELEEVIQEQIKDLIVEVLRWKSGSFVFARSSVGGDEDIVLDMALDRLLLECMTRLDHADDATADDSRK